MNKIINLNYFNTFGIFRIINYETFCLFFHLSLLLFSFICSPSIKLFDPVVTKVFGKLIYLTYQGNYLVLMYFFIVYYNSIYKNYFFTYLISYLYPLIFSISFFITFGFYLLDYSNPAQKLKREALSHKFPYLYITTHTDHFFIFPLVVFFGYNYPIQNIQNNYLVIKYTISYIILMFFNKYLTSVWPYPIIYDIELKFGILSRNMFFISMVCFMNFLSRGYKLLV